MWAALPTILQEKGVEESMILKIIKSQVEALIPSLSNCVTRTPVHPILRDVTTPAWLTPAALSVVLGKIISSLDHYDPLELAYHEHTPGLRHCAKPITYMISFTSNPHGNPSGWDHHSPTSQFKELRPWRLRGLSKITQLVSAVRIPSQI